MLLKGSEIKERLIESDQPFNERLIITPILDWEKQLNDAAVSLDVRLGTWFLTASKSKVSGLDPLQENYKSETLKMVDWYYINIGDYFVLHPGQFVLGITLEWIHLPIDLGAYALGRSSWGREGLIIATATGVHPGFSGVLILELSNLGEIPMKLYPGVTIAQLFFHLAGIKEHVEVDEEVDIEEEATRDDSIFFGQCKPTRGVPISKKDIAIIKSIGKEFGITKKNENS